MRYIRVDLPPWFSSMPIALKSSVDLVCMLIQFPNHSCLSLLLMLQTPKCLQDIKSIEKIPKSVLPIICFRDGSLPLPDVSNTLLKDIMQTNIKDYFLLQSLTS
ncbi:hypothetical protein CRYUN_Cryun20dG0028000 [Craigia yunnanensis]